MGYSFSYIFNILVLKFLNKIFLMLIQILRFKRTFCV